VFDAVVGDRLLRSLHVGRSDVVAGREVHHERLDRRVVSVRDVREGVVRGEERYVALGRVEDRLPLVVEGIEFGVERGRVLPDRRLVIGIDGGQPVGDVLDRNLRALRVEPEVRVLRPSTASSSVSESARSMRSTPARALISAVSVDSAASASIARSTHGWKSGPTWTRASASVIRRWIEGSGSQPCPWSPVGTKFSTVTSVPRRASRRSRRT